MAALTNTIQDEIQKEISDYLLVGGCAHLADTLHLVPVLNQEALYNMISDLQHKRRPKEAIAQQVCDDVAVIVEGKPEEAVFSKPYLMEL